MKLTIKQKTVGFFVVLLLAILFVMVIVIVIQKAVVGQKVRVELDRLGRENIGQIAIDVYNLCKISNDLLQQKVNGDLNVARYVLDRYGTVKLMQETVAWTVINQYTKEQRDVRLPKMSFGGKWLGQNRDLAVPTPIVDDVKKLVGGTCTIFQRMNTDGDMLRIATNVEEIDSTRAVSTYIPAMNPDREPNPVISAIMKGETYRGRAYVVNDWYLTAYEPILDESGNIIGVLYVGVRQESVESLRQGIMDITVGTDGYVFVLGGKGDQKGRYLISEGGLRDGEDIWEARDANGRFFVMSIINKALMLTDNALDYERYPWEYPGETEARMKISAITYFAPWDWVIGAGVYEDYYYQAQYRTDAALQRMQRWLLISAIIVFIASAVIMYGMINKISKPIEQSDNSSGFSETK
ncbi:Cache 3/Cache 2 fusion domain-containing protein [bacterium]|nr:Cache 3/Cache 2 fusion domain-containing protein [bacterium]MBU1066013.1 Cache 3/Cache 2 fusion domain-containing protein [bacterium]MBU1633784.1 Cache 3/Cache 2 fusion domain-containing protein [bacterium]MBU1873600.1 Cache 3/Cache 2 fusion domain-containing protein [bacterium]